MSDLSAAVDSQDLSAAVQEAEDAITRITTSLDISQDCSLCLLVAYHWDEQKIINYWSSSSQDIVTSLGLILTSGPRVLRQAPCGMCNEDKQCQLLGCLHSICPNCIKGHSESRVMNGELNLRCPIPSCGKMAASSIFLHYLSREANVMFKQTMANDFLATKAQEKRLMSHVAESFLAKGRVLVQMFKGLALKLWRDKKNLIASFLLVLFFCNLFCLGNTLTCALELGLVNLFAAVFDVWANIIKVMLLCLLYKVFQSGLYSVWIVLVLSIACFSYVMLKALGASAWFFLKNAILELLK